MSKRSETTQEEGDETILFDDGFSIVDDINAGIGGVEGKEIKNDKEGPKTDVKKEIETKEEKSDSASRKVKSNMETPSESKTSSKRGKTESNTLIISNDDDLGADVPVPVETDVQLEKTTTDEAKIKTEQERDDNKITPRRKSETAFVWVSNITKTIKASSLKKHFSECGKVNTAKVVTNGKVFFGYVEFENVEHATVCVKQMNNSVLGGKKILVSRTRPDVTKKNATISGRKSVKSDEEKSKKSDDADDKVAKEQNSKKSDNKTGEIEKTEDKRKVEEKKSSSKEKEEKKDKKPTSIKGDSQSTKVDEDMKKKLSYYKKKMETLREDFERSQVEVKNLRRRLGNEQKRSKAEELRGEKYRLEVRSLSEQLKQARSDLEKEVHRLNKKHKLEAEKFEYQRENFLKQKDELKRRQEDLDREFKKLDEAKKLFEHIKRSRKSRSVSPPSKRFRGRDGMYQEHHSPPPPPQLSSEVRAKPLLDRPMPFYEEKKTRAIYDRLGDYGEKPFPKEVNGRHRGGYVPNIPKASWGPSGVDAWKKPESSPNLMKQAYVDRYGGGSEYAKHGHFESNRKY
ncbi:hypothetical protein HHI36_015966 [Cryptolaemus montrouzieri]|uniref:RRM domain-containing protein n=1 Tax=Cryptolaemus montrouzieri TaxID=559131 RepID=A0ABD2N7C7_9CUCU